MFSLEIECDADDRDLLIAELWELGSSGIAELSPARVRAFFEEQAADRGILRRRYPGARWRVEEERDWVEAARQIWRPMEVGKRFFLVPEWRDDPTPAGRLRITVNPGMAFGTGVHETTQLCLEALEDLLEPGMRVLDVGTGSGILARAARLLGAERVYACDIDPVAIAIAGEGFVGSADDVAANSADLALANISPEAVIRLAPDLLRVLRPGGKLIASGFENGEVAQVQAVLPPAAAVRQKNTWISIIVRNEAASNS